ncbi:MAG TPA: nucleotide kinase domain-containing protein [Candidatus Acidoferrales bacterium]|nr:nucleotide kinase domain-containing protein [Candidatus Acidoferrales bacterium]
MLQREFGELRSSDFSVDRYGRVLADAQQRGTPIYSAAYRMGLTREPRYQRHLAVLDRMMRDRLPERLQEQRTMEAAYRLLLPYDMVGDFIGFQLITDLNYSAVLDFDEMEFVVAGPGAISGLYKCFGETARGREAALIRWIAERQDAMFASRGLHFPTLWGRKLQLVDVQNLFCELNKYARLAHPDVLGADRQTQIKQRYRPDPAPMEYWFPPKWGLNAAVERSYQKLRRRAAATTIDPAGGECAYSPTRAVPPCPS